MSQVPGDLVAYAMLAALFVLAVCTAVLQARALQLANLFPPIYIQVSPGWCGAGSTTQYLL